MPSVLSHPYEMHFRPCKAIEVLPLRFTELRKTHGFKRLGSARFAEDWHAETIHAGFFLLDGAGQETRKIISCATLIKKNFDAITPAFQLRGMATGYFHKEKGVGKELILRIERLAQERGKHIIWCNAREKSCGFYERIGWEFADERSFEIAPFGPHRKMVRHID